MENKDPFLKVLTLFYGRQGILHKYTTCLIALKGDKDSCTRFIMFDSLNGCQGLLYKNPTCLIASEGGNDYCIRIQHV